MDTPPIEHYQTVESLSLSPVEAGKVITQALQIVNRDLKEYQVVYIGQPCGAIKQTGTSLQIAPDQLLDLAIQYPNGSQECIDFVNVATWYSYDPHQG